MQEWPPRGKILYRLLLLHHLYTPDCSCYLSGNLLSSNQKNRSRLSGTTTEFRSLWQTLSSHPASPTLDIGFADVRCRIIIIVSDHHVPNTIHRHLYLHSFILDFVGSFQCAIFHEIYRRNHSINQCGKTKSMGSHQINLHPHHSDHIFNHFPHYLDRYHHQKREIQTYFTHSTNC